MNYRYIILLMICIFTSGYISAAEARDFSFHGIKLGLSEEEMAEEYPEFNCEADQSNAELRRCKGKIDPLERPGVFEKLRGTSLDTLLTFRNDKLVNISIPFYKSLFKPFSHSFAEFYGQPKITKNIIKNKQGGEWENTVLIWNQGAESIVYWEVDEGRFKNTGKDEYSRILFLIKE